MKPSVIVECANCGNKYDYYEQASCDSCGSGDYFKRELVRRESN